MCLFTEPVKHVSKTKIFSRFIEESKQCIVYKMNVVLAQDNAMVLPIPVSPKQREHAFKFINLENYVDFFEDIEKCFADTTRDFRGVLDGLDLEEDTYTLPVHDVGCYEASYVPKMEDWSRIDSRFRMSDDVWKALPQYQNYGFAVFKLKKTLKIVPEENLWEDDDEGKEMFGPLEQYVENEVHPMAFVFDSSDTKHLFFPTVHVHDEKVHDRERFDHTLYCQINDEKLSDIRSETKTVTGNIRDSNKLKLVRDGFIEKLKQGEIDRDEYLKLVLEWKIKTKSGVSTDVKMHHFGPILNCHKSHWWQESSLDLSYNMKTELSQGLVDEKNSVLRLELPLCVCDNEDLWL